VREIFLNFRTGDQDIAASFLRDFLTDRFGADTVFFSSSSIPAGSDFPAELLRHAEQCEVLLALIGPQWLTMTGKDGHPLLANPQDWVRREIVTALGAGRTVVPVLLGNAPRLTDTDLPADIAQLARTEYLPLRRRYLSADLEKLQENLVKLIPTLHPRRDLSPSRGASAVVGINEGDVAVFRIGKGRGPVDALPHLADSASLNIEHITQTGSAAVVDIGDWDGSEDWKGTERWDPFRAAPAGNRAVGGPCGADMERPPQ